MSLDKLHQLVNGIAKAIDNKESIVVPLLVSKLNKAASAYPQDQTIGAMYRVISKMADNNTNFIERKTVKDLYHKLFSRNTKFAQLFAEELGFVPENLLESESPKHDEAKNVDVYQVADPVLANALNSVFDNVKLKQYNKKLADKALYSVASSLDAWNLKPSNLTVDEGNEKFLVIKADYETPKGITSFYVPVETRNDKVCYASIFLGNTGTKELNHQSIKNYLTSTAGQKLKISGSNILSILTKAASENREISDAELALVKLNSTRQGTAEFFQNQVVGQKISEAAVQDVKLPHYSDFANFEKQFTSVAGEASFKFGKDIVKIACEHIVREIVGFGYSNPQVNISKVDDSNIFVSVALNAGRVGFTVPVKIDNNKIIKPNIMLCNGSVSSFDKNGINKLFVNNASDYKAAAAASPVFDLGPQDLLKTLKAALDESNVDKAEDTLNVLSNSGNSKAYAIGFQMFKDSLNPKTASTEITCNHMIKSSSCQEPVCAHTGLPVSKTFVDKYGNCLPLYRKNMAETYQGGYFETSKIFG